MQQRITPFVDYVTNRLFNYFRLHLLDWIITFSFQADGLKLGTIFAVLFVCDAFVVLPFQSRAAHLQFSLSFDNLNRDDSYRLRCFVIESL